MKLQTLFDMCNKIIQKELKKNSKASIQTDEGEEYKYTRLSEELNNLNSWCYKGEIDVQKVVRCKNCKYYKRYKKKTLKNPYEHQTFFACSRDKIRRKPEFYCYNGEEKD